MATACIHQFFIIFPHSSKTSSSECLVSTFNNWKESPLIVTRNNLATQVDYGRILAIFSTA